MTSSEEDNIVLSKSENLNELPPSSHLVSKWYPQDVEQFFDATKLCDVCRVISGPSNLWIEANPPSAPDEIRFYQHHRSHESLLHSLHSDCDLCTTAYSQWTKNNSRGIGFSSSAFDFRQYGKMEAWIRIMIRNMEPDYDSMFACDTRFHAKTCQNHSLFFVTRLDLS